MTATEFRQNLYKTLDAVAKTGEPVSLVKDGVSLTVVRSEPGSKLSRLKKRPSMLVSADVIAEPIADLWTGEPNVP